ncbi:MAG TPA: ISAs1 family transposase [Tepidisphaeraceae bacterium]|nr:ISAs1 family transposase [Tepidisphaeraceae bacterium]
MDASVAAPVLRLASSVVDPRRHNFLHPLPQMLVMALIAILCGCDGWDDVAEFCNVRQEWFKTFLSLPHGIPSHDTIGRVFGRLDPLQLEEMLRRWMEALNIGSAGKFIAIDGKSLRRSFEHAWDTSGMAHIVSAFASQNRVVLAQLGVLDKENEITAIPKLLEMLDLQGATVTIDAIGCQRDIAQRIVQAKGDYIPQVKDNQPTLHAKVQLLMKEAILDNLVEWKGSQFQDVDKGHGRIETRKVWLTTDVKWLGPELLKLWPSVKAVAAVDRKREVMGKEPKVSTEQHYYILSDPRCLAKRVGEIIRGHWSIENSLHHVLDVSFNEDQSRVRKDHGAENLSRLRRLTANLLQLNKSKKSIRLQRKMCGWCEKFLFETLLRGLIPAK